MPEITEDRLNAKLATIPPEKHEAYKASLQKRGYTWAAPQQAPAPSRIRQLLDATAEGAPTAGAMVGGAVGGAAGAAAGGVGAIPAGIAGAGIGAAGGKAYQRLYQYLQGMRDPASDTALGNASDISKSGLGGMAGQAVTDAGAAGLSKLAPLAAKVGAGGVKVTSSVPEKYGEAVLTDPSMLNRAASPKAMGKAYDVFEKYTGLRGLEATLVEEGRATAGSGELEKLIIGTANKVAKGSKVAPQELYTASQAASRLKLMAKYGEPQAQMAAASGAVKQGKSLVDDALAKVYPEYSSLRKANFESKAREAFGHVLPQNKNLSVNVLRPSLALGAVASGAASPATLLALSPAAHGLAIRGAVAASPAAKFLAKYGIQKKAQDAADELP